MPDHNAEDPSHPQHEQPPPTPGRQGSHQRTLVTERGCGCAHLGSGQQAS